MDISKLAFQNSFPQSILQIIGAVAVSVIVYKLLSFIYLHFLRPSQLEEYIIDLKNSSSSRAQIASECSKTKSWGLVTGASDGIGKALAYQLAQAGFNVVLHGRNPTKINNVLKTLQEANPRTYFHVLVADASDLHDMKSAISRMANELNALPGPLAILINNVGGTSPTPRVFTPIRELEHSQVDGLLALNACFAAQLTRALLPGVIERNAGLNAKAAILNIGSAAQIGVPMQAVYGGAKSFLRTFTLSLARELSMEGFTGIDVMYLVIGHVTDAGPWREPPTIFTPTASVISRSLLAKVGCGRTDLTPYWAHAIQVNFANSIPEILLTRFIAEEVRRDIAEEEKKSKKG